MIDSIVNKTERILGGTIHSANVCMGSSIWEGAGPEEVMGWVGVPCLAEESGSKLLSHIVSWYQDRKISDTVMIRSNNDTKLTGSWKGPKDTCEKVIGHVKEVGDGSSLPHDFYGKKILFPGS